MITMLWAWSAAMPTRTARDEALRRTENLVI